MKIHQPKIIKNMEAKNTIYRDDSNKPESLKLIEKCTFPIMIKQDGGFKLLGTCVLLRANGSHFIITAAHVANDRSLSSDNFMYIQDHTSGEIVKITEDIVSAPKEFESGNDFDIAIVKIERGNYTSIPNDNFLNYTMLLYPIEIPDKKIYLIAGYPAAKNNSFPKYKARPRLIVLATEEFTPKKPRKSEIFDFNLACDPELISEPAGLSGGGIWVLTNNLELNPLLAGISVCYKPAEKYIIGVPIMVVICMIKGFFPGTEIDSIETFMEIKETDNGALAYIPVPPETH